MKSCRKLIPSVLCLLLASILAVCPALLCSCGASKEAFVTAYAENGIAYDYSGSAMAEMKESDGAAYAEEAELEFTSGSASAPSDPEKSPTAGRKIITTVNITAETKEFDSLIGSLTAQVEELGGYFQSKNIEGVSLYSSSAKRNAELVIRVPAEKLASFTGFVGEKSNVISNNTTADDVTLTYVDIQSRIDSLTQQRDILWKLCEELAGKCATPEDYENYSAVLSQWNEAQYQLESYRSRLNTYDDLIDFCTVNLFIREVERITVVEPAEEPTVWQKIGTGFTESARDVGDFFVSLFVWFLSSLPHLVVIAAVVCAVIFLIIRPIRKRKAKKKQKSASRADASAPNSVTDSVTEEKK